jgi:hypothetical protein
MKVHTRKKHMTLAGLMKVYTRKKDMARAANMTVARIKEQS